MKIAWFSPFPPQKSGISDYSIQIVYELRKHCEVHLWADSSIEESLNNDFTVIKYTDTPGALQKLKEYDALIYNMGNNVTFHGNIFEVLMEYPGIVILHDYVLYGFYMNYLRKKDYRKKQFSLYGMKAIQWFIEDALNAARYRLGDEVDFPFNEDVFSHAQSVIVHSDFARDRLLNRNHTKPVVKINHPYYTPTVRNSTKVKVKIGKDKILLVSFGEIEPYKQIDKTIYALTKDRILRENCVYYIIGQAYPNRLNLGDLINKYNLQDTVYMLGYQPIEVVYEYLSKADIFIGLRYPTMGETSAGLIRAMACGRPCIVTDIGWYSELPVDCVVKIGAPVKVDELSVVLRRLMYDRGYREALGGNARKHIYEEYSTELYVNQLLNFIKTGS